jgi:hypothetical protein
MDLRHGAFFTSPRGKNGKMEAGRLFSDKTTHEFPVSAWPQLKNDGPDDII